MLKTTQSLFEGVPLFGMMSVSNPDLSAWATRALAPFPDFERDEFALTVSVPMSPGIEEHVKVGRPIALVWVAMPAHKAYQYKGKVLELRPLTEGERAASDAYVKRASDYCPQIGGLASWMPPILSHRQLLVRMSVEELFNQTPGEGAGARLIGKGA
jgi:hypothetical protein